MLTLRVQSEPERISGNPAARQPSVYATDNAASGRSHFGAVECEPSLLQQFSWLNRSHISVAVPLFDCREREHESHGRLPVAEADFQRAGIAHAEDRSVGDTDRVSRAHRCA